jgi:hypothetical protein
MTQGSLIFLPYSPYWALFRFNNCQRQPGVSVFRNRQLCFEFRQLGLGVKDAICQVSKKYDFAHFIILSACHRNTGVLSYSKPSLMQVQSVLFGPLLQTRCNYQHAAQGQQDSSHNHFKPIARNNEPDKR